MHRNKFELSLAADGLDGDGLQLVKNWLFFSSSSCIFGEITKKKLIVNYSSLVKSLINL